MTCHRYGGGRLRESLEDVGVRFLFDSEGNNNWGVIMAGTTFVVLPLLIVYIFAQRFIIEGVSRSGLKG